ncbi:hypothetical protein E2C01_064237 [Portunus trituberculatus]|uniref:Uncharacterized protein n=1 Tax=Portunus trituberculatus TaxID=210409 RepID=A0A5B7HIJ2_PORTR|nr:hypothetical protein [Portunus trituberculatus]
METHYGIEGVKIKFSAPLQAYLVCVHLAARYLPVFSFFLYNILDSPLHSTPFHFTTSSLTHLPTLGTLPVPSAAPDHSSSSRHHPRQLLASPCRFFMLLLISNTSLTLFTAPYDPVLSSPLIRPSRVLSLHGQGFDEGRNHIVKSTSPTFLH